MDGRTDTAGLILLFEAGDRPAAPAIRDAVSRIPNTSISFDPSAEHPAFSNAFASELNEFSPVEANAWLELLVDGLTFDMMGLAPGPALSAPGIEFRVDFPANSDQSDFAMVGLAPGPHLIGGMRSLVVAKALAHLGCQIARQLGSVKGFFWLPSRSVTGTEFFCSTVTAWANGGPFPALGLTAFRAASDGGLESVGLDFFTGQEVRVPRQLASDRAAATRLAMRLVHQLALHGRLEASERITGPDGSPLQLEPIDGGRIVIVSPA